MAGFFCPAPAAGTRLVAFGFKAYLQQYQTGNFLAADPPVPKQVAYNKFLHTQELALNATMAAC
jgi:hypothetical protein